MRKTTSSIGFIILMLVMSTHVCAQSKTTIDPNSSKARAKTSEETTGNKDPRLAQNVTYDATRKPVVDILSDLSEATGVTLYAGYNSKDWQVRDRKMNIYTKDITLAELMSSIARVMKFKWLLTGDGDKTTYRLFMDRKSLVDAETQSLRQEAQYERLLAEKREKTLADYCNLDNMSPQDLEKLKNERPFMYFFAKSGVASPLWQFFGDVSPATEALATGQQMSLSVGSLSSSSQQRLLQFFQALTGVASKLSGNSASPTLSDEFVENIGDAVVQINPRMEYLQATPLRGVLLGEISIYYGDAPKISPNTLSMGIGSSSVELPLFDPDSKMANILGRALIQSDEENRPLSEIMKSADSDLTAAAMADVQQDDSGEPVNDHTDDPALHVKIKMQPKENNLEEIEAAFAEASGFGVVSDSFGKSRGLTSFGQDKIEIKDILDKIADGFHYNWDKHSSIVEFRDRNWFRKRNAQVPQAWIDKWKDTFKDTGTLDIGDLGQIAMLTQEQFNVNIMDDDLLRNSLPGVIFPNRDLLRVYALLNGSQRTIAFSSTGLDLGTLSPDQWKQVEAMIIQRNSKFLQSDDIQLTIKGTRTLKNKLYEYNFSITSSDEVDPITWKLATPSYQGRMNEGKK